MGDRACHFADHGQHFRFQQAPTLFLDHAVGAAHDPEQCQKEEKAAAERDRPDQPQALSDGLEEPYGNPVDLDHPDHGTAGDSSHGQIILDKTRLGAAQQEMLGLRVAVRADHPGLDGDFAGERLLELVVGPEILSDKRTIARPDDLLISRIDVGAEHVRQPRDMDEELLQTTVAPACGTAEKIRARVLRLRDALHDVHKNVGIALEQIVGEETRKKDGRDHAHGSDAREAQQ